MKHLFIVNPAAGQSDASVGILKELNGMEGSIMNCTSHLFLRCHVLCP